MNILFKIYLRECKVPNPGYAVNFLPVRLSGPIGRRFPHGWMMGTPLRSLLIFFASVISGMLLAGAPIAALSGFLGVGPGFLLVPVMIHCGFNPRRAAAMNAVAVRPASFVSLIHHVERAAVDPAFAVPVVLSAACGALAGGYLASRRVP